MGPITLLTLQIIILALFLANTLYLVMEMNFTDKKPIKRFYEQDILNLWITTN